MVYKVILLIHAETKDQTFVWIIIILRWNIYSSLLINFCVLKFIFLEFPYKNYEKKKVIFGRIF